MEKASKSGLCHPKTNHLIRIAPTPKTSQWPSAQGGPGRKIVAGQQQFLRRGSGILAMWTNISRLPHWRIGPRMTPGKD
jgi:hypothetical protein